MAGTLHPHPQAYLNVSVFTGWRPFAFPYTHGRTHGHTDTDDPPSWTSWQQRQHPRCLRGTRTGREPRAPPGSEHWVFMTKLHFSTLKLPPPPSPRRPTLRLASPETATCSFDTATLRITSVVRLAAGRTHAPSAASVWQERMEGV